ncbi:hypothetical protein [Halomonas sp. E19]|uniref:hypothetical protein n=1 Tax=Halomonas sp. E19 TaxID=3397247 RepID=UPI004033380C
MPDTASRPGMLVQEADRFSAEGDWTLPHYARLSAVAAKARAAEEIALDRLGALDTSGASVLVDLLGADRVQEIDRWAPALPPERRSMLKAVAKARRRRRRLPNHGRCRYSVHWPSWAGASRHWAASSFSSPASSG